MNIWIGYHLKIITYLAHVKNSGRLTEISLVEEVDLVGLEEAGRLNG